MLRSTGPASRSFALRFLYITAPLYADSAAGSTMPEYMEPDAVKIVRTPGIHGTCASDK